MMIYVTNKVTSGDNAAMSVRRYASSVTHATAAYAAAAAMPQARYVFHATHVSLSLTLS